MSKIKTKVSLYIVGGILCSIFANTSSIINTSSVFAENLDYEVNIQPSLIVTIPTTSVELDIDPINVAFNTEDLTVTVGTNNPTGYTLSMSADDTSLTRQGSTDTIRTLDAQEGGYTEDNFTVNRWGYKLPTTNYLPFVKNAELDSNTEPTNARTSTVTFGAKADLTQPAGAYKLEINFTAVANYVPWTIANATNMQDVVAGETGCPSTLPEGQVYTLKDARDGQRYKVARLADGKCWMLDNLRFDIVAHKDDISSANTNITNSATLTSLKSGNRNAGDNYATAGVSYWTSGSSYSAPLIAIKNASNNNWNPDTTTTSYGSGSGKIGVYYNYCAASAGFYCYGNGTSEGTSSGNAEEDICPAGWRMPTGGSSGEYQALYAKYSGASGGQVVAFQNALSTSLSGDFYGSSAVNQGSHVGFWSSTRNDDSYMYFLGVLSSSVYPGTSNHRNNGNSVRCLLK